MYAYNPYSPYRPVYEEPYSSFAPYGYGAYPAARPQYARRRQPPPPARRARVPAGYPYHDSYMDVDDDGYGYGYGYDGYEDDEMRERRARAALQNMYSRPAPPQVPQPINTQQQHLHPQHHASPRSPSQARRSASPQPPRSPLSPHAQRTPPSPHAQRAPPSPHPHPAHAPSPNPQPPAQSQPQPEPHTQPQPTFPPPSDEQLAAAETLARLYRRRAALRTVRAIARRYAQQRAQFTYPSQLDFEPAPEQIVSVRAPAPPDASDAAMVDVDVGAEESRARLAYTKRNAPLHAYAESLVRLLNELDAVQSAGDPGVREARRAVVRVVEGEAARLERWWRRVWARREEEAAREGQSQQDAKMQDAEAQEGGQS